VIHYIINYKQERVTTMNILFFLTPKSEVAFVRSDFSLRQILEKMEQHKYSAIPILSKSGEYVGTITEGDILWYCKKNNLDSLNHTEDVMLDEIPKKLEYASVSINSDMEDLIARAMAQNFVPVVDDQNNFIGLVTRKDIIGYCYKKLTK
jgi:CBS domain-containing protein